MGRASQGAVSGRLVLVPAILLAGLVVVFGIAGFVVPESNLAPVNIALLMSFIGVNLWSVRQLVVDRPFEILTPLPWLLVSSALFFGFGPLLYYFGDALTVEYASVYYRPTEWELWRTDILNVGGVALALLGAHLVTSALAGRRPRARPAFRRASLESTAGAFLAVGLGTWALILKPSELGMFALPAWAVQLVTLFAQFRFAGLILLTALVVQGRLKWLPALVGTAGVLLFFATLDFSKYAVVFPFLMIFIGVFLVRPHAKVTLLFLGVAVAVYVSVYGLVQFGRDRTRNSPGYLSGRVDAVIEYRETGRFQVPAEEAQTWWTRLCYSSPEAFAMSRYDSGSPGSTVGLGVYTFIPRLFWPGKPSLTPGASFNELWTGYATSQSGPGVFGEIYWNGGWGFVVLGSLFMGVVFGLFRWFTLQVVAGGRYLFLPIALIGAELGRNFLDWFGATYVGAPIFACWIFLFLSQVLGKLVGLEAPKPLSTGRRISLPPPPGHDSLPRGHRRLPLPLPRQ